MTLCPDLTEGSATETTCSVQQLLFCTENMEEKKIQTIGPETGSSQKRLSPDLDGERVLDSCHVHPGLRGEISGEPSDLLNLDALQRSGCTGPG